jgi:hypothetical protein
MLSEIGRKGAKPMDLLAKTCNYERMNLQRILARGFVVFGGVFWVSAALGAGSRTYLNATPMETATMAVVPLAIAVVALLVGWFYERLAAVLLLAGVVVVVLWGLFAGWEVGVWATMAAFLMAEMVVSALLFLLAAQTQKVCELQESKSE